MDSTVEANDNAGSSPLDAVLRESSVGAHARAGVVFRSDSFLQEESPWRALALWLRQTTRDASSLKKEEIARLLTRDIGRLDTLLSKQVNAILHHPAFQRLEASWRGLRFLVEKLPEGDSIKIRVLNLSWKDLVRDLNNALEFDQSQLFKKIYEEEFGHPGGEPFGVLVGDYEIHHKPSPAHPFDDLTTLSRIGSVAAASFAPFIASVHPSFFDLTQFADLARPLNLGRTFEQLEYLNWRAFRSQEDSRFVGLTLPKILMRRPYGDGVGHVEAFRFREAVGKPDRSEYLWGNAAYAFAGVLIRSFAETSWLAGIRGVQRGVEGGGLVSGLPVDSFRTDREGVAPRFSTDVIITDAQERELGDLGFIPLCHCLDTEFSAFYGNQSVQKPQQFDELAATVNARLSAMLQYMLCVSRFAHYLKVISRDKLGLMDGPADCEEYLRKWLKNYTTSSDSGGMENKSKYPLREAKVQLRERPDRPGSYSCVMHLRPHFQLDQLVTAVRLRTELAPSRTE